MRLSCGLTDSEVRQERYDQLEEFITANAHWQDHFAWWPRRVGRRDCRWLETIQTRVAGKQFGLLAGRDIPRWEYKAKEST